MWARDAGVPGLRGVEAPVEALFREDQTNPDLYVAHLDVAVQAGFSMMVDTDTHPWEIREGDEAIERTHISAVRERDRSQD